MEPSLEPERRIGFLLGKPPRPATVLSEVLDCLRNAAVTTDVHLPKGDMPLPSWLFDSDLVIQRGLSVPELTSALRLEHAGVRCCNRIAATITVWNRVLTTRKLANAGLLVPTAVSAATWPEVVDLAGRQPVVVKAADGAVGRGLGVLVAHSGSLPSQAPFAGPYIVQEYIPSDQHVYKVYVVGDQAQGLLKRRPPDQTTEALGVPFTVDAALADISRQVGTVLGLEIYGVDFLNGPTGPVVVDVNPFPGFRGVPQAAQLIASHVLDDIRGQVHG